MGNIHKPTLLALLETRMADHKTITETLGFTNQIQFSASGSSGRIVIIWNNVSLNIQDITVFPQGIHVVVNVSNSHLLVFFVLFMLVPILRIDKPFGKSVC